jgi:hypothetical protein
MSTFWEFFAFDPSASLPCLASPTLMKPGGAAHGVHNLKQRPVLGKGSDGVSEGITGGGSGPGLSAQAGPPVHSYYTILRVLLHLALCKFV